ncbi:MAG: radical SAM protein [Thermodesulfobacteriota bacterium]|nr:MAG: radical SAM protein [Thermodesulfobacteriota bacterium]
MGLGYIAAVLEKIHEVFIIDVLAEGLTLETFAERISVLAPEIVGITSDTISFQRAIDMAQKIKEIKNDIIVVIGGAHTNAFIDYPLQYNCFDVAVYGEGERTIVELLEKISEGLSFETVKGIAFRQDGRTVVNSPRELIEDLNSLPFPARHLFSMSKYNLGSGSMLDVLPVFTVNTSRGCPYRCRFCSNNKAFGKKYRSRNAQNVVDEIEMLQRDYGAKGIYFREDLFTLQSQRVIEICKEIRRRKIEVKWECECRVNTVSEKMLLSMKESGCEVVWFGVESGSQRVLNYIQKDITLDQVRKAFELCSKIGLRAGASFLIGLPGETLEDIEQTVSFASELKPRLEFAWFNIYVGLPISPLYEHVRKNRLYSKDIGHGILIIQTAEFDRSMLESLQKRANRKVNFWKHRKKLIRRAICEIRNGTINRRKIFKGINQLLLSRGV